MPARLLAGDLDAIVGKALRKRPADRYVSVADLAADLTRHREGLPVLTEVRVHYHLRIPPGTREAVDRALARHQDKCPTAATLQGAVRVSWTAAIETCGTVETAPALVATTSAVIVAAVTATIRVMARQPRTNMM